MVELKPVSANLRLLDAMRKGVRTLSGVRSDITQQDVSQLLNGLSSVMINPVVNAIHTVRAELKEIP